MKRYTSGTVKTFPCGKKCISIYERFFLLLTAKSDKFAEYTQKRLEMFKVFG